jgi:hypothetical protein
MNMTMCCGGARVGGVEEWSVFTILVLVQRMTYVGHVAWIYKRSGIQENKD